jgi:ABC-type transport system involved in multi-copper enzyme maturation permease subunit
MLYRTLAIAMNAYREAVRARVLFGLFALAIGTAAYSLVVASLSLHQEARVVADIGASSISLYAVLVAVILGATSLHRELELKTIFPILSRPLRRHEYLVGKYLGMMATLAVFVAVDAAAVMIVLALQTEQTPWKVAVTVALLGAILGVTLLRAKYTRVFVLIPWAAALVLSAYLLASTAGDDRRLVVASSLLTLCEVGIVAAIATFFSSFSSPFMSSIFTVLVFLVGRSTDTLANIPAKLFGERMREACAVLAHIFPNLHVYVPARPLLLGHVADVSLSRYVAVAAAHAALYAIVLLAFGVLVFRKRDFQ